ncbi:MAG: primosomal protein [Micrococcales bacterium]|nr:primosomal protein [Micrococcales bacterium]
MTGVDPRAALEKLVMALERHLEASASRRGDDDPTVVAAYEDVADAFETYDETLLQAYGEMTPLEVYSGDGEDPDDLDDLDDEDDELYAGLDDEDYDDDGEDDDEPEGP